MRTVLLLGLALAASPAAAQPRPFAPGMPCAAVRALVAAEGAVILGTGTHAYDRYVAHAGFCPRDQTTEAAFERTADSPQCFVGYRCVSRFRDTPEPGFR